MDRSDDKTRRQERTRAALMALPEARAEVVDGWWAVYSGYRRNKATRCVESTVNSVEWYCWPVVEEAVGDGVAVADYCASHFESRQARRKQAGINNNTLRKEAMTCKAMFDHGVRDRLIKRNPLRVYRMAAKIKPHVPCPTPDQFETLLFAVRDHYRPSVNPGAINIRRRKATALAARDFAMVMTAGRCALRTCELMNLRTSDYLPREGCLVIRTAKDNEPRWVPIYADVIQAINAWLDVRWDCDTDHMFVSDRGKEIKVDWWSKHFKSFATAAELPEMTPRSLRHYGLTEMAKRNLLAASAAAGHSQLATTKNYLHGDWQHTRDALATVPQIDMTKFEVKNGRKSKRMI